MNAEHGNKIHSCEHIHFYCVLVLCTFYVHTGRAKNIPEGNGGYRTLDLWNAWPNALLSELDMQRL